MTHGGKSIRAMHATSKVPKRQSKLNFAEKPKRSCRSSGKGAASGSAMMALEQAPRNRCASTSCGTARPRGGAVSQCPAQLKRLSVRPLGKFVKKKRAGQQPLTDSATIADLKRALEDLVSRRKTQEELEGIVAEDKSIDRECKNPYSARDPKHRRPLFDETSRNTTFLLAALVVALTRDHELVQQIRSPNRDVA